MNRFIPAHAGNALALKGRLGWQSVHPRACGERAAEADENFMVAGSSPRMRGTLVAALRDAQETRFIPAHAGNALPLFDRGAASRGSSPRMRGTPKMDGRNVIFKRFIPAHAGNACHGGNRLDYLSVHPRACGERNDGALTVNGTDGSSPRMRGTPRSSSNPPQRIRFIPAHAGNAVVAFNHPQDVPVHPRACGERTGSGAATFMPSGSSPRMRGTQNRRVFH